MMQKPLFIGVDGGGTRCRARLGDAEGRVLGEGYAGAANTRLGLESVWHEVHTACEQALADAGLAPDTLGELYAGLGLAGLSLASERKKLTAMAHPFAAMAVETDAYIACLGAHGGDDGGILIFGTGSCGCAIVQGRSFTVGGWGFQLSDHGSGARLGYAALRQALLAHERIIPATPLSQALMARHNNSPEQAGTVGRSSPA